ncbi:MAG: N-acetyltransferase [Pseudomonadota bacterium]
MATADISLEVREPGRGHRAEILAVVRAAFDSDFEPRLVERLWTDESIIVERIAADAGRVVGYAAISPVTISQNGDEPGHHFATALGLAPVAVSPRHQNKGVGSTVVEATIDAAFKQLPERLLFVLGDHAYYRRFGFVPSEPMGYRWEGGGVGDAFQVRARTGPMRPRAPRTHGSTEMNQAVVRYCDAFGVFDEEPA